MADEKFRAGRLKRRKNIVLFEIASLHAQALGQTDARDAAHADTPDTDEMYRFGKIAFICHLFRMHASIASASSGPAGWLNYVRF